MGAPKRNFICVTTAPGHRQNRPACRRNVQDPPRRGTGLVWMTGVCILQAQTRTWRESSLVPRTCCLLCADVLLVCGHCVLEWRNILEVEFPVRKLNAYCCEFCLRAGRGASLSLSQMLFCELYYCGDRILAEPPSPHTHKFAAVCVSVKSRFFAKPDVTFFFALQKKYRFVLPKIMRLFSLSKTFHPSQVTNSKTMLLWKSSTGTNWSLPETVAVITEDQRRPLPQKVGAAVNWTLQRIRPWHAPRFMILGGKNAPTICAFIFVTFKWLNEHRSVHSIIA